MAGAAWGVARPLIDKGFSYLGINSDNDWYYLAGAAILKVSIKNKWVQLIADGGITVSAYNIARSYTSGMFGATSTAIMTTGTSQYVVG